MNRLCSGRPRLALVVAALSLSVGGLPRPAHAADPPPASPAPSPSNAESAEKLAEKAYALHDAGKFAEAIATYLQAYAISNAPAVLFNVATIYDRKLHEAGLAADYYRRYLGATDVEPDLVQKANARLAAMKQATEDEAKARETAAPAQASEPAPPAPQQTVAPGPPAATAAPPVATPSAGWRTVGLVLGAAGVAGLGTSAVLAVVAKGKNDDANALCNGAACSDTQGVMLAHDAGTFATASTVAFVAGAALTAAGFVVYFAAPRSIASAKAWSVGPMVARASGGLALQGGF